MYGSPAPSLRENGDNDSDERRARFRVPLISVQENTSSSGSMWKADNGPSDRIGPPGILSDSRTRPSTSSASGVTPEMGSAQNDNVELRQRRRPVHTDVEGS